MILIHATVENWKLSRSSCQWGMSSKALEAFLQNVVKDSSRQIIPSLTTIIQKLANITYDCNFLFWFSLMFWKNCERKNLVLPAVCKKNIEKLWEQKKILPTVWPKTDKPAKRWNILRAKKDFVSSVA